MSFSYSITEEYWVGLGKETTCSLETDGINISFALTNCLHDMLYKPLPDVAQGGQGSKKQITMSTKGTFQDSDWLTLGR